MQTIPMSQLCVECRFDFGFIILHVGDGATSRNRALSNMDKLTILMDKMALGRWKLDSHEWKAKAPSIAHEDQRNFFSSLFSRQWTR
jgi:hypothetical protein